MDFDPRRISYEELLAVFWDSHDPRRAAGGGQYRKALFVHSAEQRRRAEASRHELERREGIEVRTPILEAGPFHPAEDYHQKWRLRQRGGRWLEWLQRVYPDPDDLRDSTAAARLNGYLAGHGRGTADELRADLGLDRESGRALARRLGWE